MRGDPLIQPSIATWSARVTKCRDRNCSKMVATCTIRHLYFGDNSCGLERNPRHCINQRHLIEYSNLRDVSAVNENTNKRKWDSKGEQATEGSDRRQRDFRSCIWEPHRLISWLAPDWAFAIPVRADSLRRAEKLLGSYVRVIITTPTDESDTMCRELPVEEGLELRP